MKKKIGFLLSNLVLFSFCLNGQKSEENNYERTINKINAQADEQFIFWKIKNNAPHLTDSLKNILNDRKKVTFLANNSQLPFNKSLNVQVVNAKINTIISDFKKAFKNINLSKIDEQKLRDFLRQLIIPEIAIFDINAENELSNLYPNFMKMLRDKKVKNGGNLAEWSQRYLTSQTLLVSLPILEKQVPRNKNYYALKEEEQNSIINEAAKIVTAQYIANVQAWSDKFRIKVPEELSREIEQKIIIFLKLKLQPF